MNANQIVEKDAPAIKKRRLWQPKDVNNGEKSFACGLNIYKIIWVFIIGCVIGVVFETLYVYFMEHLWIRSSGMLYGPFNQIYGIGAVLFVVALYRFRKKNAAVIFLASAVIGSVFEYACSWVQQLVFGSVSWEYSDIPTNIGGRTNLFYALGWGILGLIFITHTWPFLSEMIERIPNRFDSRIGRRLNLTGKGVTITFAVLLAANLVLSGIVVFRAGRRHEGIAANNALWRWVDSVYPDSVMAEKYPSLEFVKRY